MRAIFIAQARLPEIDGAFLLQFLGAVALLSAIYLLILNIIRAHKKPAAGQMVLGNDPLKVEEADKLATQDDVKALERDLEEIKVHASAVRARQHDEVIAIHNRINVVAEGLGAIRGQLSEIAKNQQLLMTRLLK